MSEQKVFNVFSDFGLKDLAEDLVGWLQKEKKLEAESLPTEDGYIVQAKTKAGFKKLIGMDQALQVQLNHYADQIMVDIGTAKWIDKAAKGTLRTLIFTPLVVTSAIGAWQQSRFPKQVFDFIDFHNIRCFHEKINMELDEGNWEKAASLADEGIKASENNHIFYYYKVCALGGQSLFDEALKLINLTIRVFEKNYGDRWADEIVKSEHVLIKTSEEKNIYAPPDMIKAEYVLIKSKEAEYCDELNRPYDSVWSYNEACRYESDLQEKEIYKTRIDEAYKKLSENFSGLDYKIRKVMCVSDVLPERRPESFVLLTSENLPQIKFSPGHPVEGELYVGHPYREDVYFPFKGYEQELFQDKEMELTYFLQCLGAKSIEIRTLKEENTTDVEKSSSEQEAKFRQAGDGESSDAELKSESEAESISGSNRTQSDKKEVSIVQNFFPKKKPFIPRNLTWYDHEVLWQRLARQRLDGNILNSRIKISTEAVSVINENEERKIKTELEYLGFNYKFESNVKNSSETDSKRVTEREIYVEFSPIDELDQDSENVAEPAAIKSETSAKMSKKDKIAELLEKLCEKRAVSENEKGVLAERLEKADISDEQMSDLESIVNKEFFNMRMGL